MREKLVQSIVVFLALVVVGEFLVRPQQHLTQQLKDARFIQEPLSQEKQLKLGQTSSAVALGGLRSLIAAVMNLQAYGAFEEQEWAELEQLFEVIITLQPNNTYYWDSGAWHLAYNAYYDFEEKMGLSPARCRLKQREYHKKGEDFLLRGVAENPDEAQLWLSLGRLYTDPHRPYNFTQAEEYFHQALQLPGVDDRLRREYFYTLGRVKGREREALDLARDLASRGNLRYSSLRAHHAALALIVDPSLVDNIDPLISEVFGGSKAQAYQDLANYWLRSHRELFPKGNLAPVLTQLASELNVPDTYNPLRNPTMDRLK